MLLVQDFGGEHSKRLDQTRARLLRGASWKRQRIVVVLPADDMIPARVALSHWNLIFPPNNGVVRILAQGLEVGEAYSSAIENVLGHPEFSKWEFVLCIEHDNLPPQDGLLMLLESMEAHPELAAIGGLYFCRGEGGCAQIWGDPSDPVLNFRPQVPRVDVLQECFGTGMGFTLFRIAMFRDKRIARPLFQTKCSRDGVGTQDLAFWSEARKYGYRCAVDTRVRVGHMDISTGIIW